ncbi:MAG: hypothetical protein H7288_13425 [Kineosporiaceae bacterium]|nr:hypothetical protein [Aeromicrobium sp.]
MATNRQRRTRGTLKSTVALNAHVDPAVKAKIDKVCDALGKSQGQVLDLLIANADVDANGRPAFWSGPLASDIHEELPLARPA